ncbi:RagB/SusD family nutrient uptake outer membrane protein [Portibacter marinus]|uniref:RagB/SusD family nutrient uptake outer membrane protein n=1 Tax=Portibacter marinus TaxID=2898660 RepID=UPI001F38627C|nr:RagB/SusD family nutrient uptake outer membrane protein [Portibacter marinus]
MRNLTYILAIFLVLGCGEEFLDRSPYSYYTPEEFYSNETQVTEAVNALYPVIRGFYTGANWILGEFRTDNTTFQYNPADRGAQAFESHDYFLSDASNGTFSSLWDNAYRGIARANFLLENIDDVVFDDESVKQARIGETRFARAFYYYFLVNYFGDVPFVDQVLLDTDAAGNLRREDFNRIIDEIILPDLEIAIDNLPMRWSRANEGRASQAAALMLKARIHFFREEYEQALPALQMVCDSDEYALNSNYEDAFNPQNRYDNDEIIFAAQFLSVANQGAGFFLQWLPNSSGQDLTGENGINIGSLNGKNIPTRDMVRAFADNDKRKDASIAFYVYEQDMDTVPYIKKYFYPPVVAGGSDINLPIFRYAETLLMKCEAMTILEGLSDEAIFILNDIRSRAGLSPVFPGNPNDDLNVDTPEKLLELIRKERRLELAFEGLRYSDLIRYGTFREVMLAHGEEQKEYQDFLEEFPDAYTNIQEKIAIPFNEILVYGYRQNEGW